MIIPCDQNDQTYNKETETTTENTSLNPSSPDLKKEEENIFEEKTMISFWNKCIREGRGDIISDVSKKKKLLTALEQSFGGKIDKWKSYCKRIASSKFLMGETEHGFSITLDWALKEGTIQKVLEGGYTVGDRETWPVERGEGEEKEIQKNKERAKKLLEKEPDYFEKDQHEKGLKTYYFLYLKNLGEGTEMQQLLKKEGIDHPKIQEVFDDWVRGL